MSHKLTAAQAKFMADPESCHMNLLPASPSRVPAISLIVSLTIATIVCYAQNGVSNGSLSGAIQDSSGAILPGASVVLVHESTGIHSTATSNTRGIYVFPELPIGTYQAEVRLNGFKATTINGLRVSVGQTTNADVVMRVGDVQESIEVSATGVANPADPNPSAVIEKSSIDDLPLSGRRYTDFVLLTPNVTADGEFGHLSFAGQQGGTLSGYSNTSGSASNANGTTSFTVDGANATSFYYGDARGYTRIPYVFGLQAVQEFQVVPNVYSAVYGGASAGFVNTLTKSGTKDYHGDAFYYNRNSATGANDAVDKASGYPTPLNVLQQFGADSGGPLAKNKLFFYFDYEQQRQKQPLYVAGTTQSTVAESSFGVPSGTALPPPTSHFPLASTLTPAEASADPTNPLYLQGVSNALNEIQRNIGLRARRRDDLEFLPKLDWWANSKDHLTFLYNYNRFNSPGGILTFSPEAFAGIEALGDNGVRDHVASVRWVRIVSQSAVSDVHLSFVRDEQLYNPTGLVDRDAPLVQLIEPQYFALGNETFSYNNVRERQWELTSHLAWTHGKNQFEFGLDFNDVRIADQDTGSFFGQYLFLSLQDFALGKWDIYGQTSGKSTFNFTVPFVGFYGNDTVRLTHNLTVSLGLREEFQIFPNPNGNPALPFSNRFENQYRRLSPRIGFAYQPFRQTVVRGGIGIYYGNLAAINYQNSTQANGIDQSTLQLTDVGNSNTVPVQQAVVFPNRLLSNDARFTHGTNIAVIAPGFKSPSVTNASLELSRTLDSTTTVSAGTMWSHGVHLTASSAYDLNLRPPSGTTTYVVCPANTPPGQTSCAGPTYTGPNLDSGLLSEGQMNPAFGQINALISPGVNNYVSFFAQANRQVAQGVTVLLAYTYSKTTQSGVDFYNQFDMAGTHGLALQDQRHRLSIAAVWNPRARVSDAMARALLSNWSVSVLSQFNAGHPFTGLLNPAANGGFLNDSAALQSTANTAAGLADRGPAPDAGLNNLFLPWITQVDVGLQRSFHLTERQKLAIKAQAFNLLNSANFINVNPYEYDPAGKTCGDGKSLNQTCYLLPAPRFNSPVSISQPNGPRIFQFAVVYSF
jgi:Carboxypeptidase regulatory-like domain